MAENKKQLKFKFLDQPKPDREDPIFAEATGVSARSDVKRLQTRHKFSEVFKTVSRKAARAGVRDERLPDGTVVSKHDRFKEVHAANFQAFYGDNVRPSDLPARRGLPESKSDSWLDFAGTTELAAHIARLRHLGRAMDELPRNSPFNTVMAAAKTAGEDLRAIFLRYSGGRPQEFHPVEPIKDVEARIEARNARRTPAPAANQNNPRFGQRA